MFVRPLVVVCVPVLVAALGACAGPAGGQATPPSSPSSAPTTSHPATSHPTESDPKTSDPKTSDPATSHPATSDPVLSGPRTVCGEVQPPGGGPMAAVAVHTGRADCSEAMRVFRAYYRPDTPKQGSAGVATVQGWLCASNSAAQAATTGRLSSCRKGRVRVVADVIP
ncbi:hypothetical protein [Nonomuraea indica]|uniref:Subtilisin inhibitor-like n=1 Tax=Nonomuraea indica TaxID=1581193 RepID=A0ABW7ZZG9_9ACTN